MTLFDSGAMQRRIDRLLRDESHDSSIRSRRSALPVLALVLVAMTVCAWPGAQTFAADQPEIDRSVPGSMMRGSGTTAGAAVSEQGGASSVSSLSKGRFLSGPGQRAGRCGILRKRYAQSQACFAHYRMKNGGLRPGAFQRFKQLKDPSSECPSVVVP
jgi:hypothetical protein